MLLSSCVACLSSCLAVSAELVSSRRLFREVDLPLDDTLCFVLSFRLYFPLDDDILGFVGLAAVVEASSISSFSSSSFPGNALSWSSSTIGIPS